MEGPPVLKADLTPPASKTVRGPGTEVIRATPTDDTRGTAILRGPGTEVIRATPTDDTRGTAILPALAHPGAPVAELEPAIVAVLRSSEAPLRDQLVQGRIMEQLPARAPQVAPLNAAALALVGAAAMATVASVVLVGGPVAPLGVIAAVGIATAIWIDRAALRRCSPIDAPAAAMCIASLALVVVLADAGVRTALCSGMVCLGALAFAWSWAPSRNLSGRVPFERLVGASAFLIGHHCLP